MEVEFKSLRKSFGDQKVLDGIDLKVERGEIIPRRVFNLNGVTGRASRKRG